MNFNITSEEYQSRKPYPHMFTDDYLDENFSKEVQEEILSIPDQESYRYDNPFEQKYTLKDKNYYRPKIRS